ncbi:DUF3427 domain-containing protein [Zafaria sp. Z1313]|uniref:DUF3427 domain-containing protein n=1 Tax=Zafaria sp. Z1313 TaxID=3423202 RepID=UPI003D3020F4
MRVDLSFAGHLAADVNHGFIAKAEHARKQFHPQVVLNSEGASVLRTLREELGRCEGFTFSVAFVTPRAIALIKQELVDFRGRGRIITSDYLRFNSPEAFAELYNLRRLGVDVRIHSAEAFHPKGYVFEHPALVTAMVGSSNLTENAIVKNHEWNLKVSAARDSDLADQVSELVQHQLDESVPLTEEWIEAYRAGYIPPRPRTRVAPQGPTDADSAIATRPGIVPNLMQKDALEALEKVRLSGQRKAIIISATGTGKTILSALDVRAYQPQRMLFVVHREQILDRTIEEYRQVLGGSIRDFGKLTGTVKEPNSRFVFATVQTLSQPGVLEQFRDDHFEYVLIDEAHRVGATSYQRVLGHFQPKFLLGMTATPERSDGFNVFELFDYNVPYEIRLNHALEADMLSPFHYYGIADVTYDDGTTLEEGADLRRLVTAERVEHVIDALETYGQAGVAPRGLIFCSRKDEALALSEALNEGSLRGRGLRTVALSGDDPVGRREEVVRQLEAGELDYILTVDIFNEGIDIPSINQVVMLRQTQSAIVFVQQLGRGLRKSSGKEYLVVIDFIGNYANNFMIPIALFGDDSLNKESLRKNLIAAEESGVLPGLSSVRFDKISQERVLKSISQASLDSTLRLKAALQAMANRVGGLPRLMDFYRFESVDPVLLATRKEHYPLLVKSLIGHTYDLTEVEHKALGLLSHEVFPAKRLHEFVLLSLLLRSRVVTLSEFEAALQDEGLSHTLPVMQGAISTFTLEHHAQADFKRYGSGIVNGLDEGAVGLRDDVFESYRSAARFAEEVDDLMATGVRMVRERYDESVLFTPGMQYSRKEVMRNLAWPRKWTSTVYGYKVDRSTGVCPIFVTLHKSDGISESTAYEDELVDRTHMRWYTRSRRTLQSEEVRAIVANAVDLHVFVKKDDAEGTDFYYLGQATSSDPVQDTMPGENGKALDVVHMDLHFATPIDSALFDYFHPSVI